MNLKEVKNLIKENLKVVIETKSSGNKEILDIN